MNEQQKQQLKELSKKRNALLEQLEQLEKQADSLSRQQTELRLLPFHEGDTVTCISGVKKVPFRCVIEIEGSKVYVRPFLKEDGKTLNGRHLIVALPESGSYSECFQKID